MRDVMTKAIGKIACVTILSVAMPRLIHAQSYDGTCSGARIHGSVYVLVRIKKEAARML